MNPGLRLSAAIAAGILSIGSAVSAQAPAPGLHTLAERLDLTAAGSGRWLDALGVTGATKSAERLIALTSTGQVVATRDGGESLVSLGLELDLALLTPGSGIVLVHNHPGNAGLSANDLSQLAKPGVAAVVAVGRDGSIYMAARGHRYDADAFERRQYDPLRVELRKRLREEVGARALTTEAAGAHFSHVAAMALGKAGAIVYESILTGGTQESFEAARLALGRVAGGAAARFRKDEL
jgi:hypothetical protein